MGRGSSSDEDTEGVRELWFEGDECEGVGCISWFSSSSESSSSPIANAPPSSGTLLRVGVLAICGLRMLSIELLRDLLEGLSAGSAASAASFFCCFKSAISSFPLSKVKDLRASNLFRDLTMARPRLLLP